MLELTQGMRATKAVTSSSHNGRPPGRAESPLRRTHSTDHGVVSTACAHKEESEVSGRAPGSRLVPGPALDADRLGNVCMCVCAVMYTPSVTTAVQYTSTCHDGEEDKQIWSLDGRQHASRNETMSTQ